MMTSDLSVLILGGGTMGGDIASSFAAVGARTHVMSPSASTRELLPKRMHKAFATLNADPALAAVATTYAALADVPWGEIDLVIESVTENLALKQQLFAQLEDMARPGVPLVTNTSTFHISDIASGLRPDTRKRVAGLHYFMPAHLVPLVEIVRSEWTDDAVLDELERCTRIAHKAPIRVSKDIAGFIGNRLQAALLREALYLVEIGATTAQGVDDAVRFGFGFRFMACGPMKQREFAGWDGHLRSGNALYPELCATGRHGEMLHQMVAGGKLGVKTRQGFWRYTEEQVAVEKAEYDRKLLAAFEILRPELEATNSEQLAATSAMKGCASRA